MNKPKFTCICCARSCAQTPCHASWLNTAGMCRRSLGDIDRLGPIMFMSAELAEKESDLVGRLLRSSSYCELDNIPMHFSMLDLQ
jgi:hypothetical protein